MGTYLKRTNFAISSIGTTRLVTITTTTAVRLIATTGGYNSIQITNIGPTTIAYGDSSITASSAGILYYSMNYSFENISDEFSLYLISDSANGRIAVNEYRV